MSPEPWHGVPDDFEPRTEAEARYLDLVVGRINDLDVWPREMADGTPWLLLSVDYVENARIRAVPRLDFMGDTIRGAYSPASLNWDSMSTVAEAGISVSGREGIELSGSVEQLAAATVVWFAARAAGWRVERGWSGTASARRPAIPG